MEKDTVKKTLFILLCAPLIALSQQTYVPDDNFEQELINLGYDNVLDDHVLTANINYQTILYINNKNITDMTGIEDFIALENLNCSYNQITTINLNNNTALQYLTANNNSITSLDLGTNNSLSFIDIRHNQLNTLNLQNGANNNITTFLATDNPDLTCIQVDDDVYSTTNWTTIDNQHYFSLDCISTSLTENPKYQKLLRITNLFGKETKERSNKPLFYIYNDGTVKKQITIK